jgi:hypothetical protein
VARFPCLVDTLDPALVKWVQGWDKTFCLRYLKPENFDEIHFFGDKTMEVWPLHRRFVARLCIEFHPIVGVSGRQRF